MKLKIGIIQSPVSADKEANIAYALARVKELSSQGAQIAVLPEMFYCPYSGDFFRRMAEGEDGDCVRRLSRAARENHIFLVGGSIPELCGERLFNTSFIFDSQGQIIARHRKIHLFDIAIEGGQHFMESADFSAGNSMTLFDTPWGKMGVVICYDYRFPELARIMTLKGANIIFVPAAFNMTTGPAHWELMHRARSLDNQIFTIACAPARDENGVYVSYANSMAVSPWGDVLWRADENPVSVIVTLDLSMTDSIRSQLPLLSGRRIDLYDLSWNGY